MALELLNDVRPRHYSALTMASPSGSGANIFGAGGSVSEVVCSHGGKAQTQGTMGICYLFVTSLDGRNENSW